MYADSFLWHACIQPTINGKQKPFWIIRNIRVR
jgi:hypothetical protein